MERDQARGRGRARALNPVSRPEAAFLGRLRFGFAAIFFVAVFFTGVGVADPAGETNSGAPPAHGDTAQAESNELKSAEEASASGSAAGEAAEALPDDPRRLALVKRVKARWDVKIKRDFSALYEYETPDYRKKYTAEAFGHRHGAAVTWHGIEVANVRFEDDASAVVDLVLDHTYIHPFDSSSVRAKTLLREQWTEISGEWFHATPLLGTEPTSADGVSDEKASEQGPPEGSEGPAPAGSQDGTP